LSKGLATVRKIKNILFRKMKDISDVSVQLLPLAATGDTPQNRPSIRERKK
jgi:hypothetical protein